MRADLHLHSICSDGVFAPKEVARRASDVGVKLFSLTDHDNMYGCGEAGEAALFFGLHFVRGIEISAYMNATKVHMLGYGCEENEAYFRFLQERRKGAKARAADIVQKANAALSLDVTMEEVERLHAQKDAPLHTMHIVRTYAERLGADVGELYRDLFSPGGRAFSDLDRPLPEDAVSVIHAMGGVAVLAHPAQILVLPRDVSEHFHLYSREEKERAKVRYAPARNALMEKLVAAGLDGIECYHSTHTASETEEFLAFAKAHGLFVTGGSDFHADGTSRRVGQPVFDAKDVEEAFLSLKGSV